MFFLLFILWIIFNGRVTVEIVLLGIVICAWLYWFMCKHMGYQSKKEKSILRYMHLYIKYFFILALEIIKANIAVIRIILSSNKEFEPTIVKFKTDIKSDLGKVLLANSITLTPGTYTIQLDDDEYLVHALDKSFGKDLNESIFSKEIKELEAKL
ncbi:Na(+)/H(+) antiporter subunit E1 [Anaerotignum neopropionicum]|uniref:Na(+)/H(+) antiporter subunit E1 n=1 Tax=Anaerotignum neopropionicum TaxID=36847 RepID=A0A136WG33_9FIRM|nr:Na+/H+ antiporter subunit E [Anaerotignum neopropionicum]KXL53329.1 Na(+)/H(+) antiporter subunit E1 [Anaerotignum neopropionicum]